jgi:hypothetical protein
MGSPPFISRAAWAVSTALAAVLVWWDMGWIGLLAGFGVFLLLMATIWIRHKHF